MKRLLKILYKNWEYARNAHIMVEALKGSRKTKMALLKIPKKKFKLAMAKNLVLKMKNSPK